MEPSENVSLETESENRLDQQARYRREGEAMVAGWQSSGLSMAAYARASGVSERRLGLWRRRLSADNTEAVAGSENPTANGTVRTFQPSVISGPTDHQYASHHFERPLVF